MSEQEQKRIFSQNLSRLLSERNKSQREVALAIGVTPQALNLWCKGLALPRMGKIQSLADYFGVPKSRLIEEYDRYYDDDDTAAKAQELLKDPNFMILFDAARDSRPEDLQMAAELLERLKRTNPNG